MNSPKVRWSAVILVLLGIGPPVLGRRAPAVDRVAETAKGVVELVISPSLQRDGRLRVYTVSELSNIALADPGIVAVGAWTDDSTLLDLRSNRPAQATFLRLESSLVFHAHGLSLTLDDPSLDWDETTGWIVRGTDAEGRRLAAFRITDVLMDREAGQDSAHLAGDLEVTSELATALRSDVLRNTPVGRLVSRMTPATSGKTFPAQPVPADPGTSVHNEVSGVIGPDVIVGELLGTSNYGTFGGYSAFAVGTISCNIGDVPLWWRASVNEHPVIGAHLYRLKDSRFEQIGQAWLKHGFAALTGNVCNLGCNDPDTSSLLGVGCSDPYSSNLNGNQFDLGPKSEVNAFTGAFPYPPILDPTIWNLTNRRLQVANMEIDPAANPGAIYYVEGHYVTPDDAAAGNQDNNASYRRVTFAPSGGGYSMAITGSTARTFPAIKAWKSMDPTVTETQVRVPGEGLFNLAAKTTDLGNGFWRYEYALQNLNSDRSAGSFHVPMDPASIVQNIGFHDVDYHSGEPYDGTDWGYAAFGGEVFWTTASYSVNPNANALRWGTLYNFRFEANAPPDPTTIAIGLFKPGTPTTLGASSIGPRLNIVDCNNNGVPDGEDIFNGVSRDCNANNIPDECESFAEMNVKAMLVASGLSSPLYVAAPPGDSTRLFIVERGGTIRVLWNGTLLGTPFLNITSKVLAGGERGLLSVAFDPGYATNRSFYVNYTDLNGDTVVARYQATSASPNLADSASEVVLKHIAQDFANHNGGQLQFGPDGMLYVGMGDGGSSNDPFNRAQDMSSLLGKMLRLDVDNPPTYVPADNPFVGSGAPLDEIWASGLRNPWRFSFDRFTGDLYIADVGQDALEEIDHEAAGQGAAANYGWRCMEGTSCTGRSGCTCNNPSLTLPILEYSHAAGCSITGGYVYRGCQMPFLSGAYFYADFCSGFIRSFRLENGVVTDQRDRTAEITSEVGSITSIASFGEDASGEMYIVSLDGNVYKIVPADAPVCGNGLLEGTEQCDDNNAVPGDGCDENCEIEPGNPHDQCTAALFIAEGVHGFNNNGATTEGPQVPVSCAFDDPQISSDLWYCYRPSCTGTAAVALCGSSIDTGIAVYEGCSCPTSPSAFACNDDSCSEQSEVTFPVTACGTYLLQIGNVLGGSGAGHFQITCDPSPIVNDCNFNDIDDAVDIACGTSPDGDENDVPDECETGGDRIVGGKLYDKWWTVIGVTPPVTDHPLWTFRPDPISNQTAGAGTWRCKECHGWDYKGVDGQYGQGPHRTGFPGVIGHGLDGLQLFDLLREPPNNGGGPGVLNGHDYGTELSDQHIQNLVAFLLPPQFEDDAFIEDATAVFIGDEMVGETNYTTGGTISCINCHGTDGTNINFGTFEDPEFVGTIAVNNPWELLHKIRFGQPGTSMPSWLAGGGASQGAADIGRYAQLNFPTDCVVVEQCDDGIDCTADSCDATGRCAHAPDDSFCPDDGLFCNGAEICDPLAGCANAGNPCAIPGDCSEIDDHCGCVTPLVQPSGSRYLLITPQSPDPDTPMALVVTPDCPGAGPRYAGAPSGPRNVAVLFENPSTITRLTPAQWGTVAVTGLDVVPDRPYLVQSDCGSTGNPVLSEPALVTTRIWGDVAGYFNGTSWTPPDGIVQIQDAVAILDGFQGDTAAPPLFLLDSLGCVPDRIIDIVDVVAAIDAFRGRSYAQAANCPVPCP